ncbi:uncharacterized protein DSM5745_05753 [Aspergillus mulundensis]|uniref:Uncharacterized protein n=1 Tax=Aspergillus mulundensis TaxID=1810919 RepID=A0A3D8RYJ8_9EURO|nr:hypothetical protein DSM5745_05753 [Aspergillus mulundensis]RDW78901.1 hypothetical protein DSM5745_05753 [Aspergillus mulundensis]
MALPTLPPELIFQIVSEATPFEGWGRYWPLTRSVIDVKNFLALRLVCKEFNNIVLDYFFEDTILLEEFDNACLQRCDPPTPGAVQMCRCLLLRHLERTSEKNDNAVSIAFRSQLRRVVDTAVDALHGSNGNADVGELREIYTQGLATAVIGFSGCSRPMDAVAGARRADEEDEVDEEGMPVSRREPNQQDLLNMALTTAATLGRLEDMEVLIEKGADSKFEGQGRWVGSALHGAAIGGQVEAMDMVMGHTRNADRESVFSGNTPLHYAAMYGNLEVVHWLLGFCREPDETNEDEQTPLFFAASCGHAEVVKEFFDNDYTMLKAGQADMLDLMDCASSDDDNSDDDDSSVRNIDGLTIIDIEADDYRGRTPMMMAVQRGYADVVNQLMWRADVKINRCNDEEYDMSLLATAASKGYEQIFRLLLQHPEIARDIKDSSGNGILKHAAVGGNESIVREVLTWHDVDVNARGDDDSTPIMWAALYGHECVVKLLIDHGASVDLRSSQLHLQLMRFYQSEFATEERPIPSLQLARAMTGRTTVLVGASALDAAAHGGHEGTVGLLISQPDIELDQRDLDERTPLANAALTEHAGVVKLLLARRDAVDPEAQDKDGCTPLMLGARGGDVGVIRALLQDPRVDVNRTDNKGWTALAHAANLNKQDAMKLLVELAKFKGEIRTAIAASKERGWPKIESFLSPYLQRLPEE